jgi:hypothetical protein
MGSKLRALMEEAKEAWPPGLGDHLGKALIDAWLCD